MTITRTALSANKGGIAVTYGLLTIENLLELLYPFAIGMAINGLLTGSGLTAGVAALAPLMIIWLAHLFSGYFRQRFDTRLFTRINASISTDIVLLQRADGEPTSEIAARTDMVEELVEFLEHDFPVAITALFSLVGGAAILFYYDWLAGTIMATLLIPATVMNLRFGRQTLLLEKHYNDRAEQEVDLIASGRDRSVARHFLNLARWRVKVSDAEARTWSTVELFALVLFGATLIVLTGNSSLMAGDIFAAVAYALSMIAALDVVPETVGTVSRMIDNIRRFD